MVYERDEYRHRAASTNSTDPVLEAFLYAHSDVYKSLSSVRAQGWKNPRGDIHFKNQRTTADEADYKQKIIFYNMMREIGDEMQKVTGALKQQSATPEVLDLCMAPGGYTAAALKFNPQARVSAISLPPNLGGHEVLVPHGQEDSRVTVTYVDITMFATEFGVTNVPSDHPDKDNFYLDRRPYAGKFFDLIFCDGQVLRTHASHRADYRKKNEASRLTLSQLLLAMERIKVGGTLIMLLHRVDVWSTIKLLVLFDEIANIRLFKPRRAHTTRSSFYLIAKNVDPGHIKALSAKQEWRQAWKAITFSDGTVNDETDIVPTIPEGLRSEESSKLLECFGARLVKLGDPIWNIQAKAIERAPWFQSGGIKHETGVTGTNGSLSCVS